MATTTMLGDVARNIVADDASIEVLLPIGADPHSFSPSSQQIAAMNDADLVIINGLGLEEAFEEVIHSLESDGVNVLELGPLLDPLPFGSDSEAGAEVDHDHGSFDPHVWLDPLRMADAARVIAEALIDLDSSVDWLERGDRYASELEAAHTEISQLLSTVEEADRVLVTNHDSLGYFADRYGFEVVGTVLPGGSTLGDPSSDHLANLVSTMQEYGVRVIFAETTEPITLAEAVASELGESVEVVELHTGSLGEPGTDTDTLVGMLLDNARLIAAALGSGG